MSNYIPNLLCFTMVNAYECFYTLVLDKESHTNCCLDITALGFEAEEKADNV